MRRPLRSPAGPALDADRTGRTRRQLLVQLFRRAVVVGIVVFILTAFGRAARLNLDLHVVFALAVVALAASMLVDPALWPDAMGAEWAVQVDVDKPQLPRERGARYLAQTARNAEPKAGFTTAELREQLRRVTADLLVRRHDAPASDPFASASGLLSPQLLGYLTSSGSAPTVRRQTLASYLKEIEAL